MSFLTLPAKSFKSFLDAPRDIYIFIFTDNASNERTSHLVESYYRVKVNLFLSLHTYSLQQRGKLNNKICFIVPMLLHFIPYLDIYVFNKPKNLKVS